MTVEKIFGFDLETTGINRATDDPVQIGFSLITKNKCLTSSYYVRPDSQMTQGAFKTHKIDANFLKHFGIRLSLAVNFIHKYLRKVQEEQVPIAIMNLDFDITIIENCFQRFGLMPLEWNLVLDPLGIDRLIYKTRPFKRTLGNLCHAYNINTEKLHNAGYDSLFAAKLVLAQIRSLNLLSKYSLEELCALSAKNSRTKYP